MSLKENDDFLEWLFEKELAKDKTPEQAKAEAERQFEERG